MASVVLFVSLPCPFTVPIATLLLPFSYQRDDASPWVPQSGYCIEPSLKLCVGKVVNFILLEFRLSLFSCTYSCETIYWPSTFITWWSCVCLLYLGVWRQPLYELTFLPSWMPSLWVSSFPWSWEKQQDRASWFIKNFSLLPLIALSELRVETVVCWVTSCPSLYTPPLETSSVKYFAIRCQLLLR